MNSPFTNRLSTDQINQSLLLEHERNRRTLWMNVAAYYASASNATNPSGGPDWADIALRRFDEKFPAPQQISIP
jgi:hypothetical protein